MEKFIIYVAVAVVFLIVGWFWGRVSCDHKTQKDRDHEVAGGNAGHRGTL